MTEALQTKRAEINDMLVVSLQGDITEDSHIEGLKENLKPIVVFDLKEVKRINSYGIRQWINVMKEIHSKVRQIVFHRCPSVMVEQFNMINNFGGGGIVYSVYLPYYCEKCGKSDTKLYSLPGGATPEEMPTLPTYPCAHCSQALTFNDIEDEYFYFLQHQKTRSVPMNVVEHLAKQS
ncbi:MAG TPA: hypothetical protein VI895_13915 [Bdellovibrionota bacterium]|nr:hypothetical protein [Bdellovibrionota bacterium]